MALLYPNLSAAAADINPPASRSSALAIYRFWRDLGYAIGALGLGLAASLTGAAEAAFWFVATPMFVSGGVLFWLGEETHPLLNPDLERKPHENLILLNDPPYGTERSLNGLRPAHALAKMTRTPRSPRSCAPRPGRRHQRGSTTSNGCSAVSCPLRDAF